MDVKLSNDGCGTELRKGQGESLPVVSHQNVFTGPEIFQDERELTGHCNKLGCARLPTRLQKSLAFATRLGVHFG